MAKRTTQRKDGERDLFGKRRDILDGARRAFARGGFDGTSIDDIIAEAGVARRTLYQHFSGKEDLFAAIIKDHCEQLIAPLRFQADAEDPYDVLSRIGENAILRVTSEEAVGLYRLVIAESARFPELGRAFYRSSRAISGPALAQYLAEQTKAGILDVENPEIAAEHFLNMLSTTLRTRRLLSVSGKITASECREWVRETVGFFLKACGYRADRVLPSGRKRAAAAPADT